MQKINLQARLKNFNKNFKYKNFKIIAPFANLFELNNEDKKKLDNAARSFLNSALKQDKFKATNNIAQELKRKNYKNISTSGIIVPKFYCSLEYNLLMRRFYKIIDNLGINIKSYYSSLPVRIKFGDFTPTNSAIIDSGILHVDSTTGFSTNCFAIFLNLSGDIQNNYIKFWKIKKKFKEIPFELLTKLNISEEVKKYYEPISFKLKFNEILVADNLIYHQTIKKKNCGPRISIDQLCEPLFMYGKDIKNFHRKKDLELTNKLLSVGEKFIFHYPHTDQEIKKTFGLRSPAYKQEIKF